MGNRVYMERLMFIAILVALSVVLSFIDRQLSVMLTVQGARIGLANIVVMTGIYYLSTKDSLILVFLKAVISGLLLVNFTAFLIGLMGSILSYLVMLILFKVGKERFSYIGISVAGSIAHNIGQIIMLLAFYSWGIMASLMWLLPLGIATGIFIGTLFTSLKKYLDKGQVFRTITAKDPEVTFEFFDNE